MPLVSVLIPSYNHSQYINECVDSVLAQTYKDVEIVVVDDGSTDGSREILRSYGDKILFVEQPNKGTQAARNAAIQASSGEFLALLDSDDVWLPEKLERQVPLLVQKPDVGLVYSLAYLIDTDGEYLNKRRPYGWPLELKPSALQQLMLGNLIPSPTALFRRSCLDNTKGFDERFFGCGDWDLWLRISTQWEIAFVPEQLALYREHKSNTTKVLLKNREFFKERYQVLSKTIEQFPRLIPDSVRKAAFVSAEIWAADAEIAAGNIDAAGVCLAKAVEHDSHLLMDSRLLLEKVISWAYRYCGDFKTGEKYRGFVNQIFVPLMEQRKDAIQLYRATLSEGAMRIAFERFQSGDLLTVRSFLPIGIKADPNWLRNRGVWSIAIQSILGIKATSN